MEILHTKKVRYKVANGDKRIALVLHIRKDRKSIS